MQTRKKDYRPVSDPGDLETLAAEMNEDAQDRLGTLTAGILRQSVIFANRKGRKNFITPQVARGLALALVAQTGLEILDEQ